MSIQRIRAKAEDDLYPILARCRPHPSDVMEHPELGLALAPRLVRTLRRRIPPDRRPACFLRILRACERRWRRVMEGRHLSHSG